MVQRALLHHIRYMHIIQNKKCEKCSMVATYSKVVNTATHYYCNHHEAEGSTKILHVVEEYTFKKLLPLLSMFIAIAVLTIGTMIVRQEYSSMSGMMYMMAYFFLVFGIFKMTNLRGFADAYATYDVLAQKSRTYALTYPFIEITLGILYFFSLGEIYRDLFTFVLMSIGTAGVWKALQKKDEILCACLGTLFSVPMTKVTLFENLFMALMALYMVLATFTVGHMAM